MIRRLLARAGWVPAPRLVPLVDRAWAEADRGAVKRRDALRAGLDDLSRARLHREADQHEATAAELFARADRLADRPTTDPRRAS